MKKIEDINKAIKELPDTNGVSDGYHTFGELYDHRIQLFITMCNYFSTFTNKDVWKSKTHHDGTNWDGWFIAGINHEKGEQISYHLPIGRFYNLHVPELEKAPEWDGHTSQDVIERLKAL